MWGGGCLFGRDLMATEQPDKRSSPRFPWDHSIRVIPMDNDWKQSGPANMALAKDLSRGGIAFRQMEFLADSHAAIMLSTDERVMLMLMQILRCREVNGEFEIAGRFLAKLTDFSSANEPAPSLL